MEKMATRGGARVARKVIATHVNKPDDIKTFKSLVSAAKGLGASGHSVVRSAIRNETIVNGYTVKFDHTPYVDNNDINPKTIAGENTTVCNQYEPISELHPALNELLKANWNKIRKTNENIIRISVIDLIYVITQNKQGKLSRLLKKEGEVKSLIEYFKFEGQGQHDTAVIAIRNAPIVLNYIIANARMTIEKKSLLTGTSVHNKKYTEIELHDAIKKAFQDQRIRTQYSVGDKAYRIDLYFLDHNLAIECDEDEHKYYNKMEEKERAEYFERHLGCTWIRYDPYDNSFNIFELIYEIRSNLKI